MKKRILAALMASVLSLGTIAASAQDIPAVRANEREIVMDVQGEYVDGVFMVPIRRLCLIDDARCDWYGDEQKIVINTKDSMTRIFLYIGSDTMSVLTFTSIIDGYTEEFKLDAPLKIVNDRTLVPFEQLCKTMKMDYEWSEDKNVVTVKTDQVIGDEKRLEASIVADKEDVSAGEEVTLTVMLNNLDLYPGYGYSGYSAGVVYDLEEFELVSSHLTDKDGNVIECEAIDNPKAYDDGMKVVCIANDIIPIEGSTAIAGKIKFKALTDNGGVFRLSDRISSVGYDTSFLLNDYEDLMDLLLFEDATVLKLNTDDVVIK